MKKKRKSLIPTTEVVSWAYTKRTVRNAHHVPVKQWRKWPSLARVIFNELYSTMNDNQKLFLHPEVTAMSAKKWKTVAWNASWIAADAVKEHWVRD